jgi:hypothetical protein
MNIDQSELRNLIRATCRVHRVPITESRVTDIAHQAATLCDTRNALIDFIRDELRKPQYADPVLEPAPENPEAAIDLLKRTIHAESAPADNAMSGLV